MRLMRPSALPLAAALLGLACLPASAATLPAPIAPAAAGQLQCIVPDTARKTCQSIAAYTADAKGAIINTAQVVVSQTPVVVMTTASPVTIKDNQVCAPIRPEDIGGATFTVGGKPADAGQASTFRAVIQAAMARDFGQMVCTGYVPGGGALTTQVTINGAPQPGGQKVIWVSPADGYRVSP